MELKFFSIDEVKEFVKQLKGTRGGKGGDDGDAGTSTTAPVAPAPLQPPTGAAAGFNPTATQGFAPPAGGAGPAAGAFPAVGAPTGPDPVTLALVQRNSSRIDWCLQPAPAGGGQAPDAILQWFRGQCGPDTANYTLDQIKQVALPRAPLPTLEGIAKLMNA